MPETTIRLDLPLSDVNVILNALGGLPYKDVYQLITTIQQQAAPQAQAAERPDAGLHADQPDGR